jgi:hypothetical protein
VREVARERVNESGVKERYLHRVWALVDARCKAERLTKARAAGEREAAEQREMFDGLEDEDFLGLFGMRLA